LFFLSKHENNAILYLRLEQTSAPSREYLPNFENSNIAIQGHARSSILVPIESALCDFLLVTNSNFGRISYRFRDLHLYLSRK